MVLSLPPSPLNDSLQVFPKAPKLQASQATLARQDTIDEGGEVDSSPPSRDSRVVIEGSSGPATVLTALSTKERNLALERERQIEMASSRATTSDTYDTGLREQPPTLAQRDRSHSHGAGPEGGCAPGTAAHATAHRAHRGFAKRGGETFAAGLLGPDHTG